MIRNRKLELRNSWQSQGGFSVIEVLLASALFVVFSSSIVFVMLQSFDTNRLGAEQTIANQYAAEGIEAARSIRNQGYTNLVNTAGSGITRNGSGVWVFSGANNTLSSKYTRVVSITDVQRDSSGNIVSSAGTLDPDTKKVTSTVSWNVSPTRNNSINLSTYLTNWRKQIVGNWASPTIESSLNTTGTLDGLDIAISGNYAYIVRRSGTANFVVVDIANTTSPSVVATLTLSGNLSSLSISGNYAYVTSDSDTSEVQIVNISNPLSPTLAGTYNAAGNTNANAVVAIGTTVYLARNNGTDPEFMIINASNPASPTVVGSLNLVGNALAIYINGSFAYIASDSDTNELQIVTIANPAAPVLVGSLDLSGSGNALTITGFGNTVFIGRQAGELDAINVSNPASPTLLGTFNIGVGNVNDISLGNTNTSLFLVSNLNTGEFKIIDITNPSTMTLFGNFDVNPNNTLNAVLYDETRDRAFAVGTLDTQELILFKAQ